MSGRRTALVVVALATLVGGAPAAGSGAAREHAAAGTAKNVIFFVGDGLGAAHRLAGQLANVGADERLVMDALPYAGLVTTVPDDPTSVVSDSAAAATAYATGVSTANGRAGTDRDGRPLRSILEIARDAGKATGMVSTSALVDASLAGFGAHVADRDDAVEIARQYVEETRPDVMLGGGEDYFLPVGEPGAFPDDPDPEAESMSVGAVDLIAAAEAAGYEYVSDADGLAAAAGPRVLGVFANEDIAFQPDPTGDGLVYEPRIPLADLTAKAIDLLSQDDDGFFLVVEEDAGLDTAAHDNLGETVVRGVAALDAAVAEAAAFAEQDGETLVIVTADHETGGLTIEGEDDPEEPDESGVAADDTSGISGEDGPFPVAGDDRRFVMDWSTIGHTAVPVPLTATGPGAERLTGVYPNAAVFAVMLDAMGLDAAVATPAAAGTPVP